MSTNQNKIDDAVLERITQLFPYMIARTRLIRPIYVSLSYSENIH